MRAAKCDGVTDGTDDHERKALSTLATIVTVSQKIRTNFETV